MTNIQTYISVLDIINDSPSSDYTIGDVSLDFFKQNKVLLRFYNAISKSASHPNLMNMIKNAAVTDIDRTERIIDLIRLLSNLNQQYSLNIIPFKSYFHLPDMGDDIDLFSLEDVSSKVISTIPMTFSEMRLNHVNRLLGNKKQFYSYDESIELEFHYESLGIVSEFEVVSDVVASFPSGKSYADYDSHDSNFISSLLFIHLIQRVYTKCFIRMSDIIFYQQYVLPRKEMFLSNWSDRMYSFTQSGLVEYFRIMDEVFVLLGRSADPIIIRSIYYKNGFFFLNLRSIISIISKRCYLLIMAGKLSLALRQSLALPLVVAKLFIFKVR